MNIALAHAAMSRPPRIPGFDYRGLFRYALTFCVRDRLQVFTDAEVVMLVLERFRQAAAVHQFAILTYCFMPDHVHLLIEGLSDQADLRAFVKFAKQSSGRLYANRHGRPLWQEGYHDRVLRPSDDAKSIARYIIGNPVRAGIVESPLHYPYVGSDLWSLRGLLESLS